MLVFSVLLLFEVYSMKFDTRCMRWNQSLKHLFHTEVRAAKRAVLKASTASSGEPDIEPVKQSLNSSFILLLLQRNNVFQLPLKLLQGSFQLKSMPSANIFSSSKGFYYVLKVLGLAPYGFERKNLKFQVTVSNYLQFILSVAVWIIMTSIEIASKSGFTYTVGIQSKLLESLWQYQFTCQRFLATFTVIYSFVKREHVENFLTLIHSFDQHLVKLQWKVQPRQMNAWFPVNIFLLSSLVNVSYTVFLLTLDGFSQIFNVVQGVVLLNYFIVNEFFLMVSMQFIMSVNCINQRLNVLLENVR